MSEQGQSAEVVDIGGEVQIVERAPMTVVGIENLLRLAETADKRVEALNKLRLASIRSTNDHDWIDQDGTPYLQASGAQKIAPLWGIGWQIISHTKTTGDDSYIWTTVLRLTDPAGRIVETIGHAVPGIFCSLREQGSICRCRRWMSRTSRRQARQTLSLGACRQWSVFVMSLGQS